jgi:nitrate reductase gamma subunit
MHVVMVELTQIVPIIAIGFSAFGIIIGLISLLDRREAQRQERFLEVKKLTVPIQDN